MKRPLVSILICTYNAEKTITSTLKSCLDQTYDNFEILIHDDQSKDKTIEVINNIWDNRIRIIESWKKLWPYAWLNFLLDNAKGEYIAIQDHDDIWHPEKIEKQVKFLEDNKKYVWCGTSCLEYYDWEDIWFIFGKQERDVSYGVAHTSLVFRNQWYRYDTTNDYLCDWYFLKYVLTKWKKLLHIIPETLTLHYNRSDGKNYSNLWFKYNMKNFRRYFEVYWFTIKSYIYSFFLFFVSFFKWSYLLQKKIMFKINGKLTKEELMKDKFCKELVKYY